MKKVLLLVSACQLVSAATASAASLMFDFGPTTVAAPFLELSPGHDAGAIPSGETTWNNVSSAVPPATLVNSDNSATVVTLTLGQEVVGGPAGIIDYSTAIANVGLAGTGGGTTTNRSLLTTDSIYGSDTTSTAVGRDGFFGGGTQTGTGVAAGLRVNGLTAGDYFVFVMARNTNSNALAVPMNVYAVSGTSASTFDFNSLTPQTQANTGYLLANYTDQFTNFTEGENFVRFTVRVAAGAAMFVAVDGANQSVERRGFVNMVQIVPVPEPSTALLGALGLMGLFRRQR